jgi:nucleoside-diphosphate-sugar epimerase
MNILITGTTGYIGTRLSLLSQKRSHTVYAASRNKPVFLHDGWFEYDFFSTNSFNLPKETNVVIHLAAKTNADNGICLNEFDAEIIAANMLITSTRAIGARFIFVSSQTARPDAPTSYGRNKWQIEQEVLASGGWVVRPGQVYGGELRGLFGVLANFVKRSPILPAFMPGPNVQPIHVDDLAEGILRIAERNDINSGVYCLGATVPVNFSIFLGEIAKSRLRLWRLIIPIPVFIINTLVKTLGDKFGLERLTSLLNLPFMDTRYSLNALELDLRPLRSGMHSSGTCRRRDLLIEGHALLCYLLKKRPGIALLRRYVLTIEQLRDGYSLGLPSIYTFFPTFLSLLNSPSWFDKTIETEFLWRLDVATVLAEATPVGAFRFLGLADNCGMFCSLLSISTSLISELFWRLLTWVLFPIRYLIIVHAKFN